MGGLGEAVQLGVCVVGVQASFLVWGMVSRAALTARRLVGVRH